MSQKTELDMLADILLAQKVLRREMNTHNRIMLGHVERLYRNRFNASNTACIGEEFVKFLNEKTYKGDDYYDVCFRYLKLKQEENHETQKI